MDTNVKINVVYYLTISSISAENEKHELPDLHGDKPADQKNVKQTSWLKPFESLLWVD